MNTNKDHASPQPGKRRVCNSPQASSVEDAATKRGKQTDPREDEMHIKNIDQETKTARTKSSSPDAAPSSCPESTTQGDGGFEKSSAGAEASLSVLRKYKSFLFYELRSS